MYKFGSDEGFRSALATWAYFTIIFFGVGMRADLSILLGFLAGLAVWNIVGYLKAEKLPDESPKPAEKAPEPSVIQEVGTRIFDRLRRPSRSNPDGAANTSPIQPAETRWRSIGLRRPPKRYLGGKRPRRIGR